MKRILSVLAAVLFFTAAARSQVRVPERLSVGGYGEIALSRNFYSDNV